MTPTLPDNTPKLVQTDILSGVALGATFPTRPYPGSYWRASWKNLEWLQRLQSKFRPRWRTVPETAQTTTIGPHDSFFGQASVKPGSWLWAASAFVTEVDFQDNLYVNLRATGPQQPITLKPVTGKALTNMATYGLEVETLGHPRIYIFPAPMLLLEPALIDVEMYNSNLTEEITAQVVLYFLEPREDVRLA